MPQPDSAALLVVDLQPDFLPGGALAVADSDALVAPIAKLMRSGSFGTIVATQDWHPPRHISFASQHPPHRPFDVITLYGREQVLWPDHCVAGSSGAELAPSLPWAAVRAIVRKGTDPAVDSYSGFRNNFDAHGQRPPTGLAGYLRDCGITAVTICGLARDYCVRWSAEDAAALGFTTTVFWDLTRPVDPASDSAVRHALATCGVRVIDSSALR
jgi:nicotinamidase/pyrazinamidase